MLLSASACFGQTKTESENAALKVEACKVYKAALGDEKPLVISESIIRHIEFGKRWAFSKRNPDFEIVQSATLKSFKTESHWCETKDFVNLTSKKTLITRDEIDSYFENLKTNRDADLPFIEKYGTDHYYEFSNVGFNKKTDQALLTLKWQSISFTGSTTSFVILSKINGEWKIIKERSIESS